MDIKNQNDLILTLGEYFLKAFKASGENIEKAMGSLVNEMPNLYQEFLLIVRIEIFFYALIPLSMYFVIWYVYKNIVETLIISESSDKGKIATWRMIYIILLSINSTFLSTGIKEFTESILTPRLYLGKKIFMYYRSNPGIIQENKQ